MAAGTKLRTSEVDGALSSVPQKCPSCRSDPAFNPGMTFKVSSKCYHRICEGCVDRKFVSGRAPCPIESCKLQLWKSDWRAQTFEDLQMERDIDTRKRVMRILDRTEDEFETKRDWDNFLELREEFVMNLVLGTDAASTNRRLKAYEEANAIANRRNIKTSDSVDSSGLVRGLKKTVALPPLAPYDPFMGMPRSKDFYQLRDDYTSRYDRFKEDNQVSAGGYDFQQYWDESLLRAFAGLGVFIDEEKAGGEQKSGIAITASASDDVF